MTRCQHLYLVQTPLQLLNAYEARQIFGGNDDTTNHLIVFAKENTYHNQLVSNTLRSLEWQPSLTVGHPATAFGKLRNWLILQRHVRRLGRVTKVYIGEYSAAIVVAAANLCTDADFWLVDDGTSSLSFAGFRYRGVRDLRYPLKSDMPLLGFRSGLPAEVTFFSIYDLELCPPDKLERNRLSFLGSNVSYDDAGPVLFIGSPLPDNEEMSFERFFELMKGVRRHLGERPIIYHPHRAEHMNLKAKIFNDLAIEIVFNELPFELALARRTVPVSAIAGFYTTPLDTLRLSGAVTGNRLISFFVDPMEISTPQEADMAAVCYRNYEATPGMQVVRGYAAGT